MSLGIRHERLYTGICQIFIGSRYILEVDAAFGIVQGGYGSFLVYSDFSANKISHLLLKAILNN